MEKSQNIWSAQNPGLVLEEIGADGGVQLFQGSMEQKQLEKAAKEKAKKDDSKLRAANAEEARKRAAAEEVRGFMAGNIR